MKSSPVGSVGCGVHLYVVTVKRLCHAWSCSPRSSLKNCFSALKIHGTLKKSTEKVNGSFSLKSLKKCQCPNQNGISSVDVF